MYPHLPRDHWTGEETKTVLRRTSGVLDALLRGLPDRWVHEMDRVPDFGSGGWGFESLPARIPR